MVSTVVRLSLPVADTGWVHIRRGLPFRGRLSGAVPLSFLQDDHSRTPARSRNSSNPPGPSYLNHIPSTPKDLRLTPLS